MRRLAPGACSSRNGPGKADVHIFLLYVYLSVRPHKCKNVDENCDKKTQKNAPNRFKWSRLHRAVNYSKVETSRAFSRLCRRPGMAWAHYSGDILQQTVAARAVFCINVMFILSVLVSFPSVLVFVNRY